MPQDILLRPGAFATTTLHPDQMILFPTPPSLADRGAGRSRRAPTPPALNALAAVIAFLLGFIAGAGAMGLLQ